MQYPYLGRVIGGLLGLAAAAAAAALAPAPAAAQSAPARQGPDGAGAPR